MDRRCIRGAGDNSIERVNLANQMAFPEAAYCWIAGHRSNLIAPKTDESGLRAHARGCRCGLATCMATTNH